MVGDSILVGTISYFMEYFLQDMYDYMALDVPTTPRIE